MANSGLTWIISHYGWWTILMNTNQGSLWPHKSKLIRPNSLTDATTLTECQYHLNMGTCVAVYWYWLKYGKMENWLRYDKVNDLSKGTWWLQMTGNCQRWITMNKEFPQSDTSGKISYLLFKQVVLLFY